MTKKHTNTNTNTTKGTPMTSTPVSTYGWSDTDDYDDWEDRWGKYIPGYDTGAGWRGKRAPDSNDRVLLTYSGTGTDVIREVFEDAIGGWYVHVVTSLEEVFDSRCDAVILLGGADINPFYYGEESRYSDSPNRRRDTIEWALARRAMTEGLPLMGICRGHQMITIAHGGSLWQDIYNDRQTAKHEYEHELVFPVTTPLRDIIPTRWVNSLHHQATRTVPRGFAVAAVSTDNIIEALWAPGVLGVQFHPELMISANPQWIRLFQWFSDGLTADGITSAQAVYAPRRSVIKVPATPLLPLNKHEDGHEPTP